MESPCPLDGETLSRFLDEELTSAELRQVEVHLVSCPACDERVSQFRLADRLLARVRADRQMGKRAASLSVAAALVASLAANLLLSPVTAPRAPSPLVLQAAPSGNLSSFYETVAPPEGPVAPARRSRGSR